MRKSLAIISVIGRDQKGVVARVSTYLAAASVNIENIEQKVVEGLFIMTMTVDLSGCTATLDELVLGLKKIGEDTHMDVTVRLSSRKERKQMAILVTKEPHCLEALLADQGAGLINAEIISILSNHETLRPLAKKASVPFFFHPSTNKEEHERFVLEKLSQHKLDLVVLARYMQILSGNFVSRYPNRIINIHPSLLPFHPGANAYKQAYEEGVRVSGCTAHIVTEHLDQGPVILQDVFHIRVGEDTLEDVKTKGKALEGQVLSKAVQLFVNEQLVVIDKKVVFRPGQAHVETEVEEG